MTGAPHAADVPARSPADARELPWSWPAAFAVATLLGLLSFSYYWLDDVVRGHPSPPLEPLVEELTGAWGVMLLVPFAVRLARRHPPALRRRGLAHAGGVLAFSAASTTWNWVTRSLLFPLLGLGPYDYGQMPLRYLMELPKGAILYVVIVAFVVLLDRYRAAREREVRVAYLEAGLARAQLQNLSAQLQPHFLFNALNTISSVMYEDVERADRMVAGLSELLRASLRARADQEIALAEELQVLERYLELMRARFGERLRVEVDVDDAVRGARVPALLLQPIVENALRHGAPPPPECAHVVVRARRMGGELVVEVRDNGPGLRGEAPIASGVGLANTADRLRALYGGQQSLEFLDATGGGLIVRMTMPFRESGVPAREEAWSLSAS
ncbi:MAG TPA: histidine kinase [Longimicrobium sp.]|nr:histidine kinase [Longimicrobium sp.]